jgi:hypothetical protein
MPTLQPGKLKPEKTAKSMWLEKAGGLQQGVERVVPRCTICHRPATQQPDHKPILQKPGLGR